MKQSNEKPFSAVEYAARLLNQEEKEAKVRTARKTPELAEPREQCEQNINTEITAADAMVRDVASTLAARGGRHGNFNDNAEVAQNLKDVVRYTRPAFYARLTPVQKESVDAILCKIARIITGDHEFFDHFHDIGGYAKLAEVECKHQEL